MRHRFGALGEELWAEPLSFSLQKARQLLALGVIQGELSPQVGEAIGESYQGLWPISRATTAFSRRTAAAWRTTRRRGLHSSGSRS